MLTKAIIGFCCLAPFAAAWPLAMIASAGNGDQPRPATICLYQGKPHAAVQVRSSVFATQEILTDAQGYAVRVASLRGLSCRENGQ